MANGADMQKQAGEWNEPADWNTFLMCVSIYMWMSACVNFEQNQQVSNKSSYSPVFALFESRNETFLVCALTFSASWGVVRCVCDARAPAPPFLLYFIGWHQKQKQKLEPPTN